MKPTIGRIVHFQQVWAWGPDATADQMAEPQPFLTRAAIVTGIREVDGVDYPVLRVLADGISPMEDFVVNCAPLGYKIDGVQFSETPKMGCWNWPPCD